MSNRTVIYYGDLFAGATLTASTESTGYEKEYLTDYTKSSLWKSTADPGTITVDLGAATLQSAIWVGGSNMTSADTYSRYWVGTAVPPVTKVFSLDMQADAFSEIIETYRYGKVMLSKAAGSAEAGKVYLAQYKFELPKDFTRGYSAGNESVWVENRGRCGQVNRELQYTKYVCSFDISGMENAQKVILDETIRLEPTILFWDGELQKAFYGILTLGQPEYVTTNSSGNKIWNINGTFEEIL